MPRGVPPAAIVISLLALVLITGLSSRPTTAGNGNGPTVPPEIQAAFDADGAVEVIVALENEDVLNALRARTGGGRANGQAQADAAQEFRGRIDTVVGGLPADASSVETYEQFGAFSLTVTDQRTLDFVARHPLVKGLEPVRAVQTAVASSLPFINQGGVAAAGLNGGGTSVAIIDTGINFSQSFFGSCSSPGVPAACRVAVATEFGDADGNLQDDLGHGTNVAGIAGSVAPQTSLLSLDVFTKTCNTSNQCSWGASTSDILDGLNWVIANSATYNTKAVNLSLGGPPITGSPCDGTSSATTNAFATLRTNGVLPVIAAGNNANKNAVSWPACVTGAHAVGAVYDGDYGTRTWGACGSQVTGPDIVTCFSNSHETLLDSLAPGTFIDVAGTQNFSGTSMAAPHVAGAAAALSNVPATLTQVESALTSTGPLVTDTNGVAKRRLDLCQAAASFGTRDPEFSSTPPLQVVAGHAYTYQVLTCGFGLPVTLTLLNGPTGLTMSGSGLVSWSPTGAHVGISEVTVEAQSTEGTTQQTWNIEVKPFNLLFALQSAQTLSSVSMADEDIVAYDGTSFSQFFDGSDVGISGTEIAAFEVIDSDEVLLAFRTQETVTGAGTVDDSDIVKFTGTLGPATSGTFSLYFDGSDVGLAGGSFSDTEKIDALGLRANGDLLISTNGAVSVTGASGAGEDLIQFTPQAFGATTTGSWSVYWDGSDVGFDTTENLDGVTLLDNRLYFSTTQAFSVPGPSGQNEDVFLCKAVTSGSSSFCGGWEIFFDGSLFNLANNNLVDLDFPPAPPAPVAPTITSTAPTSATVGEPYSYQAAATGTTPIAWSVTEGPSGLSVDANSGLVTWTPGLADVALSPHSVTIGATNGAGSDSQTWQITVSPPPAPVITSTPGTATTVDQPYSYQASATGVGPITWALDTAPTGMTVDTHGLVAWTPDAGDIGDHPVTLEATNVGGTTQQPFAVTVSEEPVAPPAQLYFAVANDGTVGAPPLSVANEDIVAFDGASFSIFFDGSSEGLAGFAIDAFAIINSDEILLSFTAGGSVPDIAGTTDDSDVVKYTISTGTFAMFFDGSDVGLTTNAEDIDAIHFISNTRLALSTNGAVSTSSGFSAVGQDLIRFTFADGSSGANTTGAWRMWWDGSDTSVGLTLSGENIKGASLSGGRLYLTTSGNFTVTGASGANEDVFVCETPTTGPTSVCGLWNPVLFFDGSAYGLAGNNLVGISVP